MPHRLALTTGESLLAGIFYCAALIQQGLAALLDFFSEKDWDRLLGPHGVAVVCLIALVVQWNTGRVAERNRDRRANVDRQATEDRHKETVALMASNADKLAALNVESIKAIMLMKHSSDTLVHATERLHSTLESSPCLVEGRARLAQMPFPPAPQPAHPELSTANPKTT